MDWRDEIIKSEIRKKILEYRNSIDKNTLLDWSGSITDRVNQLQYVDSAENIMCFVSFGSEVYTHALIRDWLKQGKKVSVPCIERLSDGRRIMHAVRIESFSDLKAVGSFGILEPELKRDLILQPDKLQAVIVPGSVFDIERNRIGYGGGFYDRFLAETSPNSKKIAVCFDFQVIDSVPHEKYDVPVDIIVTEKRLIG